jgi:CDP-glycerol glycerophosphotransferase (TagB/SpsB family)
MATRGQGAVLSEAETGPRRSGLRGAASRGLEGLRSRHRGARPPRSGLVTVVVSAPVIEAASLADALRSLAEQERVELDVVVAPWGEGNQNAFSEAAGDARVAVPAGTGNGARNAGAALASGDHMVFLDHRTRLRPGALAVLTGAAAAHPGCRVVRAVGDGNPLQTASYLFSVGSWTDSGTSFDEAHGDFPDAACARSLSAAPVRVDGRLWDRVPRTGAAPGAMPSWAGCIDDWLRMVPAVRQMVHGPEKTRWIRDLVANELPGLLADAERLPHLRLPDLADTVGAVLAALPAGDLARLPVETRAAAWLGGQARWSELADFLAGRLQQEGHFPTRVEGSRVYAQLPGVDWEALRTPPAMLEVGLDETRMICSVRRVRWLEDTFEETPGLILAVDVFAGIRNLSLDDPLVQARWVSGDRTVATSVEPCHDPLVWLRSGQRHHDHAAGSVTVTTPLGTLPPGTWRLEIAITQGEVVRTGRGQTRDRSGSAGELRPSPDGSAQPVWDAQGLRLLVAAPQSFEREPVSALRVTGIRHEAGRLVVETTGPVRGVPVLRSKVGQLQGLAEGNELVFRLRADPFGTGELPAPSGRYRLAVAGRPVRWDAAAADALAFDLISDAHRIGLRRSPQGSVVITLRPPLRDGELGAFAQQQLRASYDLAGRLVDQVLLESAAGQACTGSPLAIDLELARSHPELRRLWSVEDHATAVPPGATRVLRHSREWFAAMARSRWVVVDGDLPAFFHRREGQQVIQTLAGYPSKTMGVQAWEELNFAPSRIRHLLERSAGQWTALVVPTPRLESYFRSCFRYRGVVLPLGLPRNDVLVGPGREKRRAVTRGRLGIDDRQIVVLYAPEPGAHPTRSGRVREDLDLASLCSSLGGGYTVLFRGAGAGTAPPPDRIDGARLVEVTDHPEVADLMLASDAALLDYSSLRFDYALTGQPMVFHVPDPSVRNGDARGFLFPYLETAPGPVAATTDEVVELLLGLDLVSRRHATRLAAFNAQFNDSCDGHAAERVVASIVGARPRFGSGRAVPGEMTELSEPLPRGLRLT